MVRSLRGSWRRRGRRAAAAVVAAGALLAAAGCGGSSAPSGATDGPVTVTVFAAGSLVESFRALERAFVERNPEVRIELGFGHSPEQVVALGQGAPADVLATASDVPMREAARRGLLAGPPRPFAGNRLRIVVPAGNPRRIRGLADLADPALTLLVPDPQVPAGRAAQRALQSAGVTVTPDSFTSGVKPVVTKVGLGEADAGIVYATDIRAGDRVAGVDIAPVHNVVISYPIAVTRASHDPVTAGRFVAFVNSADGRAVMGSFGFLPP